MKSVFLGPVFHWLLLIALVAAGWVAGKYRVHVSEFNPFIIAMILATVAVLILVLRTSAPEKRVTRDPIANPDTE